jgi:hypothetical protein
MIQYPVLALFRRQDFVHAQNPFLNQYSSIMRLKKKVPRVVIHNADIVELTGYSLRTARNIMQAVRKATRKTKKWQLVTIRDFRMVTGVAEGLVREYLVE